MQEEGPATREAKAALLDLPAELIDNILSHLAAHDLAAVSATCVYLRKLAFADIHWHRCVQDNVHVKVVSPGPCTNYRHLYLLHDRLWFLPKFKLWFCDRDLAGRLIIARYDPRRGCIEAYQLVAVCTHPGDFTQAVHHAHHAHHIHHAPHAHHVPLFQHQLHNHHFNHQHPLPFYTGNPNEVEAQLAMMEAAGFNFTDFLGMQDTAPPPHGSVFRPRVRLHLDKPVLQFRGRAQDGQVDEFCHGKRGPSNRYADEIPMALEDRIIGMFSNFILTRPLDPEEAARRAQARSPYSSVWPPPTIPAPHRVAGARPGQYDVALALRDRPLRRSQVSDQTFRIRQWIELAGTPASPVYMRHGPGLAGGGLSIFSYVGDTQQAVIHGGDGGGDFFDAHGNGEASGSASGSGGSGGGTHHTGNGAVPEVGHMGVHIGEEIITYSTLQPSLYEPTPERPWRGIWVGDYSIHGCEFLLIHQPDDPPATDEELGLVRHNTDSDADWERRRLDARIHRGRLDAVKLTGDPNIPRGEITFMVEDMGAAGFVRTATEPPIAGARVVHARGHIAATGFVRDKFINCQLVLLNQDRLALFWGDLNNWSYFERVDIDAFLTP